MGTRQGRSRESRFYKRMAQAGHRAVWRQKGHTWRSGYTVPHSGQEPRGPTEQAKWASRFLRELAALDETEPQAVHGSESVRPRSKCALRLQRGLSRCFK